MWQDTEEYPIEQLTSFEIKLRDKFVEEYFKDENYLSAAVRVGYSGHRSVEFANLFECDAYVQTKIQEIREATPNVEDANRTPRQLAIIKGLTKEAYNTGPGSTHSARVTALAKLATIENMDAPTKIETKVEHSGTVNVDFDYSSLSKEELKLVRQLLESRLASKNAK